eukprot:TRINITY_DN68505_c0_g1_i1.p1 TRINITY_DN68505_c0_g1~~TRINITY_DN68505_c0_g1_i1.p1  ORF type:complete len:692 (-),score=387.30 TRINITY_DN68505_c0_g1_i1:64-1905(-)
MKILFGSQSGTAESFAEDMGKEAKAYGFKAKVVDLEDYDHEQELEEEHFVVFVVATFGEGDPTDSAAEFWEWINGDDIEEEQFEKVSFACFALGNRQYEHFCHVGRRVSQKMRKYGANEVLPCGEGDDDGSLEDDFAEWKAKFWVAAREFYGEVGDVGVVEKTFDPTIEVGFLEEKSEDERERTRLAKYHQRIKALGNKPHFAFDPKHKGEFARVVAHRELRANTDGGESTAHVELSIKDTEVTYRTADNLGVYPRNSDELVEAAAKRLGIDPNAVFWWKPRKANAPVNHKLHFPKLCSVRNALAWYCDLGGLPKRAVIETVAIYAKDEADKKRLMSWTNDAQGKLEYTRAKMNMVQVLERCPSVDIPFAHFLEFVPKLQPRFYTISSSVQAHPDTVHATVSLTREQRPDGAPLLEGVCSRYMCRNMQVGDLVPVFVRQSSFVAPWSLMDRRKHQAPVIMIGPGTGVAPFRAFLQEASYLKRERDTQVGELTLFFGCRYSDQDWIYRDEMEQWQREGVLTNLITAFSREPDSRQPNGDKTYVQHRMLEHQDLVWRVIDNDGYFYVCGGTQMGRDVKAAMQKVIKTARKCSDEEAHDFLQAMQDNGRFIQELWS